MAKVSKKATRRFIFLSIAIFGVFIFIVISSMNYWTKISDNKAQKALLETEYDRLLAEEKNLKSEVTKLQDPDYVARYASEKYLYSKDGMTIIRIID